MNIDGFGNHAFAFLLLSIFPSQHFSFSIWTTTTTASRLLANAAAPNVVGTTPPDRGPDATGPQTPTLPAFSLLAPKHTDARGPKCRRGPDASGDLVEEGRLVFSVFSTLVIVF
jgi:hypothetical protein